MVSNTYQFPKITQDMHNEMHTWLNKHNNGLCAKSYHGAIGGNISFEITPTALGDFIAIKCSCGKSYDLGCI